MAVQTLTLAGRKFVILPERNYARTNKALLDTKAHDRADVRLAGKRLSDPRQKPIPYQSARRELGLA